MGVLAILVRVTFMCDFFFVLVLVFGIFEGVVGRGVGDLV